MEPTSTMASKCMFIEYMWVWRWISMVASDSLHPPVHFGTRSSMGQLRGRIYTYTPLRYWITSTWVPYGCVHVRVHPDMYTLISTRTTALWRQLASTTMSLADPPTQHRLDLRHWSVYRRGPGHHLATCIHLKLPLLPMMYGWLAD